MFESIEVCAIGLIQPALSKVVRRLSNSEKKCHQICPQFLLVFGLLSYLSFETQLNAGWDCGRCLQRCSRGAAHERVIGYLLDCQIQHRQREKADAKTNDDLELRRETVSGLQSVELQQETPEAQAAAAAWFPEAHVQAEGVGAV